MLMESTAVNLQCVPSRCSSLVQQAYAWGACNRETNILSVRGDAPAIRGLTLPTFLPESG
jgi:hypothetical protein